MKYMKTLLALMVIVLSFSLAAPACAASSEKSGSRSAVHNKNAKSSKLSKSSKQSKLAKSSKSSGKHAKKLSPSAKSKKQKDRRSRSGEKAQNDMDSREIWLTRAKNSELLAGQASWYGKDFHQKATASGIDYDMYTFTAAHRTLPIGTIVKVTDASRGKSVMVCVTDRGPYVAGRIIDLSYAAARKLNMEERGVCNVSLEVVSDEYGTPLKQDHAYFVRYGNREFKDKVGPFKGFADAAAMHEALSQAHPDAEVILDPAQ